MQVKWFSKLADKSSSEAVLEDLSPSSVLAFHSYLLEFHANRGLLTVMPSYKQKVVFSVAIQKHRATPLEDIVRIFLNNTAL